MKAHSNGRELRGLGPSRWRRLLLAVLALTLLMAACNQGDAAPGPVAGDRRTISLALLDDPHHRAALYAVEQAIATSDTVDLDLTYLPLSTLSDVASAKQYDVIEVTPLAVARAETADFTFIILSAGLQDLDGTLLIVPAGSELRGPGDLRGKTLAVPSLGGAAAFEARFLLQERYGLDMSSKGGDVAITATPFDSLPTLLQDGDVDAAIVQQLSAFQLQEDERFRVLSHVTEEMRELIGVPVTGSVLGTYPDVAQQKADALVEVNRLLVESVTYFRANQEDVIEAVAVEQETDPAYSTWWWERQDLPLGDLSMELQEQLLAVWKAASATEDIEQYPDLASVLFIPEALEGD